jgi:hypothetical protein
MFEENSALNLLSFGFKNVGSSLSVPPSHSKREGDMRWV